MKEYSMKSHNRRVHQRWLNKFCRDINKSIYNDNLWRGRFVVEQLSTQMDWFEDKSGGILRCVLRFRDKKTGHTKLWHTDCLEVAWNMFFQMNDFIVKDCAVWDKENPYKEIESWR